MSKRAKKRQVFCTIAAQHDNLGDIVIRQRMLDLVDSASCELHVSIGSMPADYVRAFDLPPGAVTYRSTLGFTFTFLLSSARRRSSLLLPPGPYPLTSLRAAMRSAATVVLSIAARLGGGASVTVGKSLRGSNRAAISAERALVGQSAIYVARDTLSAKALGRDIENQPDLALLGERSAEFNRQYLAISLRYDKRVDLGVLQEAVRWARANNLTPVFVTQVKRDGATHERLADKLGAEHLAWDAQTHRLQQERISNLYAQASLVLTDRLHAALLGALGGAVPVAVRGHDEPSKIIDAIGDLIPVITIDRSSPAQVSSSLQAADTMHEATRTALDQARERLVLLRARVRTTLAGRSLTGPGGSS